MSRTVGVVYASQPHFTPVTEAETAEICQSQWVERQQYLCLSVNIQNTSLEVALNKTTESYNDYGQIKVDLTQTVSPPS